MKHTIIHIFILIIITQNIYAQSTALNVDDCCCPDLQTGVQDCAFGGQSEDTTIMVISTDITSAGANDGTFTVWGTGIYDVDFSTGMMADSVMSATDVGLSPDIYTVTITDEVGCIATGEVVIEEPEPTGCCCRCDDNMEYVENCVTTTQADCINLYGAPYQWIPDCECGVDIMIGDECTEVHSIPTLSEWSLIILALLMLIIGVVAIRSERDLQSAPAKT